MPRIVEAQRQRARAPKTRTGCSTCKSRRIKCDEGRPYCQRCTFSGRVCGGYLPAPAPSPKSLSSLLLSSFSDTFDSSRELRAFQFFQERTVPQLTGYYECDLWDRIIVHAVQVDPGCRHAIVALSDLHERFAKTGQSYDVADSFALRQYGLAIRDHLARLNDRHGASADELAAYIASSLVFFCIEMLQLHYASAISLIQHAIHLFHDLRECAEQQPLSSSWPMHCFEAVLSRLEAHAVAMIGAHAFCSALECQTPMKSCSHSIPVEFRSIAEARKYFEFYRHWHNITRPGSQGSNLRSSSPQVIQSYRELVQRWCGAFEALQSRLAGKAISWQEERALAILKIRQLSLLMSLEMTTCKRAKDIKDDQGLFDPCTLTYHKMLELAEFVQDVDNRLDSKHDRRLQSGHAFTLDIGIVGPLYDIARSCRDPVIRRRAIRRLRSRPCREGLMDSLLAAKIAERIMELEEAASGCEVKVVGDVPPEARILACTPVMKATERTIVVGFARQQGSEKVAMFEEVIKW